LGGVVIVYFIKEMTACWLYETGRAKKCIK